MHVSEGQLYAATVADFTGGEPLIHRDKIRTERLDLNQLNGKSLIRANKRIPLIIMYTFLRKEKENIQFSV